MFIGESAALFAALLWTVSSMLWGRVHLSAMTLNLCKNVFGLIFILGHLAVLSLVVSEPIFSAGAAAWGWLIVSGLLGILIGDAFYFRSLQILGPRLSLMLMTMSPFFAAILGYMFLGEGLTTLAISGIVLTVGGVFFVVLDRKAKHESPGLIPGNKTTGITLGILGALCQAIGGVLSRRGMVDPVSGESLCDPAEAAFIRILVAAIGTALMLALAGKLKEGLAKSIKKSNLKLILPATAMGTWLGIWLSQVAFQNSNVAIAQTLLSTCPLFAIPIVVFYYKQKVTALSIAGTLIAIIGIYLVTSS